MTTRYKLDKSFGPVGSFSGIILCVVGLILVWFSLVALILIFIGAFTGFSASGSEIDFDRKRVRFLNILFGLIKTGTWVEVRPDMKMGIVKTRRTWRTYSAGNRQLATASEDYRLVLFHASGKKLMEIKKSEDVNAARKELDEICNQLKINKM